MSFVHHCLHREPNKRKTIKQLFHLHDKLFKKAVSKQDFARNVLHKITTLECQSLDNIPTDSKFGRPDISPIKYSEEKFELDLGTGSAEEFIKKKRIISEHEEDVGDLEAEFHYDPSN